MPFFQANALCARLYAHRAILSVWSEYFATLLMGGFKEEKEAEIALNSVDPDVFSKVSTASYHRLTELTCQQVIKFLYVGTIVIDGLRFHPLFSSYTHVYIESTVWTLLELANMYHIDLLKKVSLREVYNPSHTPVLYRSVPIT